MKLFLLIYLVAMSGVAKAAPCGSTSCYDYCSSGYVQVLGDSCDTSYNYEKNCYEAFGFCKNSSGQNSCQGKTTSCYDYCTNSYITVQGDTCESTYDFNKGCYTAQGSCSR